MVFATISHKEEQLAGLVLSGVFVCWLMTMTSSDFLDAYARRTPLTVTNDTYASVSPSDQPPELSLARKLSNSSDQSSSIPPYFSSYSGPISSEQADIFSPSTSISSTTPPTAIQEGPPGPPPMPPLQLNPQSSPLKTKTSSKLSSQKVSPWFPSVPASSCKGIFQFTIYGTAHLKIEALDNSRQHNITLQITSANRDSVSARLWIDENYYTEKGIDFNIKNMSNDCKYILYKH
jgi:hypothetical protein